MSATVTRRCPRPAISVSGSMTKASTAEGVAANGILRTAALRGTASICHSRRSMRTACFRSPYWSACSATSMSSDGHPRLSGDT